MEFTKEKYKTHPYRRGYLLTGKEGSGKSAAVELIASRYNKAIFMVTLNSLEMDDSILINLIKEVPPNSVVVFDEIDKQLETIKKK